MGFGEAISICFKKYADFTGRARRSEYWWFFLFTFLVSLVTCGIGGLVCLLPMMAVQVRRLHDTNRSGWWVAVSYLLGFVLVGIYFGFMLSIFGNGALYYGNDSALARAILTSGAGWGLAFSILAIVQFIVRIIVFVFTLLDSDRGPNQYGPSPKYQ